MQGKACAGKFLGGATLTCDCFCLVCHRWFWLRRWWWWCIKNSRAKAAFDGRGKKTKSRVSKLNLDLIDFEGTYVYFLILKQAINKNIYICIYHIRLEDMWICGLSLLLVLSLALRCYLLGTLVFPLLKNPHFQILISSRTCSRQRASLWLCYCKKHLLILSIKFVVSWACYCWWRYFELMAMAAQVPWLIRLVLFSHF